MIYYIILFIAMLVIKFCFPNVTADNVIAFVIGFSGACIATDLIIKKFNKGSN